MVVKASDDAEPTEIWVSARMSAGATPPMRHRGWSVSMTNLFTEGKRRGRVEPGVQLS